ncbi:hypothetical protein GCM10023328_15100 [Modestobacter marinus]|uniref:Uncharacterized protein n=1 Tax=Modestobacter marinus TaxID=477641 RepID=A0A846LMM8_9ACTN|nr:hypothetical protein [Modestobacter marinus]NIH68856.1 hypothetical protein [Modestobacter marinus]GGL60560.1 hypothetical protein GCM10011589_15770 [Modestobacter marinus]
MELFLFLALGVLLFRALGRSSRPAARPARPRTDTWLDGVVEAVVELAGDVTRGVRTLSRLDADRRGRRGRSPWS